MYYGGGVLRSNPDAVLIPVRSGRIHRPRQGAPSLSQCSVAGSGTLDEQPIEEAQYCIVAGGGSAPIATETGVRVAAVAGAPHDGTTRQRGSFVE